MIIAPPSRLHERPIPVSYTAWTRFKECELMERNLRAGLMRRPKPVRDFLVGNVVHKCLEHAVLVGAMPTNRFVYDTFRAQASKPGVKWNDAEDARSLLQRSARIVAALAPYVLSLVKAADGFVRSEIEIFYDVPLYHDAPDRGVFRMTAKLDMWIASAAGTHYVIDYKSGSSADRRQLAWYAAVWSLVSRSFDPRPRGRFFFLYPDAAFGHSARREVTVTADDMRTAIMNARQVAQAIDADTFVPKPTLGKCKNCRVNIECPASVYSPARGRMIGGPSVDNSVPA